MTAASSPNSLAGGIFLRDRYGHVFHGFLYLLDRGMNFPKHVMLGLDRTSSRLATARNSSNMAFCRPGRRCIDQKHTSQHPVPTQARDERNSLQIETRVHLPSFRTPFEMSCHPDNSRELIAALRAKANSNELPARPHG